MMPDAMVQAMGALCEQYLEKEPHPGCFLCHQPAVTALVYVSDTVEGDRVQGAVFAVCAVCWVGEDFQDRTAQAFSRARTQRRGVWN
jgi:hypothetical protein